MNNYLRNIQVTRGEAMTNKKHDTPRASFKSTNSGVSSRTVSARLRAGRSVEESISSQLRFDMIFRRNEKSLNLYLSLLKKASSLLIKMAKSIGFSMTRLITNFAAENQRKATSASKSKFIKSLYGSPDDILFCCNTQAYRRF